MKADRFDARAVYQKDLFREKRVLITGGGSGIGRLVADGFAQLGANLVLAARKLDRLESARDELLGDYGIQVTCLQCDIADPKQVQQMVAGAFAAGEVHVLVNNAGANSLRPTEALTPVRWKAIIDTVLSGTYYVTREVCRRWIRTGYAGRVINMASTTGWTGSPYMAPSGAAKAGIINLGRTLGSEWGRHGIRINDVSPGPVFTKGSFERLWLNEDVIDLIQKRVPLGRFPGPEDIVGSVLFLASPAADFITGASIAVDGGESLKQSFGELVEKFRPRRATQDETESRPDL
ncbi:MAG: SDR family oxidoreductase [Spirochaetales bacterium]|nr:SDR family oxidoreductase [Spirochaetales bacterium]MCP5486947.1 SDR family oxidoreductase [Spirochaetales bacterium]